MKNKNEFISCSVFAAIFAILGIALIAIKSTWLGVLILCVALLFAIGIFPSYKKWKQTESKTEVEELKRKLEFEEQVKANQKQSEELKRKLEFEEQVKANQKQSEELKKKLENFKEFYIIPKGYEVINIQEKTTRIRGVYYNNILVEYLHEGLKVGIEHKPTIEFPENTEIFSLEDGEHFGKMMKEMAEDFVKKYGKNFKFCGEIIDFDSQEDDEELANNIIITLEVPIFQKIKIKKDSQDK